MASFVVLTLQSSIFVSSMKPSSKSLPLPTLSINPLTVFRISSVVKHNHNLKLKHLSRASFEGFPSELAEDSKFVPLNAEDPQFGPPALLLLGFDLVETAKIQEFLKNLDGEFLKIIHCTEDMISRSLWEAMHTEQANLESVKIAKSLPRICFLSGLTGEEMMMFIEAFPESGLESAVFAALVPNSADKLLQELIDEIMGDHEMVTAKESGST
ncbi:hypothetical protein FRX31_004622 [Thalictrum thalictroides]|uniref:Uncharacterized protein n=1 Tax=Thalictrum thalictroides TaxID=46969 RepID=A0A7J6X7P2_THATH|nr:hypothetical protein FRX31_004622 [Thalictrum thalictroides]